MGVKADGENFPGAALKTSIHYKQFFKMRVLIRSIVHQTSIYPFAFLYLTPILSKQVHHCDSYPTLYFSTKHTQMNALHVSTFLICAFTVIKMYQNDLSDTWLKKTAVSEKDKTVHYHLTP